MNARDARPLALSLTFLMVACAAPRVKVAPGPPASPTTRPGLRHQRHKLPYIASVTLGTVGKDAFRRYLLGGDYLLLRFRLENPRKSSLSGFIACRETPCGREPAILHRFIVEAGARAAVVVPLEESPSRAYALECRLQYPAVPLVERIRPGRWVKVRVPAAGEELAQLSTTATVFPTGRRADCRVPESAPALSPSPDDILDEQPPLVLRLH